MKKILHVSAVAERGGLEAVLLNVLKCLDRSSFVPLVLLLENGPFVREVEDTGTEVHVIDAGRVREILRGGKAVAKVLRLIRSQGIHLVHCHNAKAHIYGGLAAAIAGVPNLYHIHGVPRPSFTRDGVVSLLSVAVPAARTVACSAYAAGAFGRAWHSRKEPTVVHNGVLTQVATVSNAPSVREEFEISDDSPLIVTATRFQKGKGVHVLLDAAAHVATDYPGARFIVAGGTLFGLEKEYEPEVRQQVERLGLSHAVRFVGFRSDMFRFYSAADLVVQSSIEPETFGMVLAEAMACAKPVVASDIGGAREIVENGVTGLLIPPGDAGQLAKAILSLLGDPGRRVRMGQAGAVRARDLFSADRMVRHLEAIYDQMLDEKVPQ